MESNHGPRFPRGSNFVERTIDPKVQEAQIYRNRAIVWGLFILGLLKLLSMWCR